MLATGAVAVADAAAALFAARVLRAGEPGAGTPEAEVDGVAAVETGVDTPAVPPAAVETTVVVPSAAADAVVAGADISIKSLFPHCLAGSWAPNVRDRLLAGLLEL